MATLSSNVVLLQEMAPMLVSLLLYVGLGVVAVGADTSTTTAITTSVANLGSLPPNCWLYTANLEPSALGTSYSMGPLACQWECVTATTAVCVGIYILTTTQSGHSGYIQECYFILPSTTYTQLTPIPGVDTFVIVSCPPQPFPFATVNTALTSSTFTTVTPSTSLGVLQPPPGSWLY